MYPAKKPVTRSAIIISCPGPDDNYLSGTIRDLQNMVTYLTSPKGGMWKETEIVTLDDPAWAEAWDVIGSRMSDFVYVYFSGHGCSDQEKRRYLAFRDGLVEDIDLFNGSRKQLIVADSCRDYRPVVSGIPPAEEDWSSYTGESWARSVFDDAIMDSPDGLMIVHATHDGAEAWDVKHGKGGAFTISLLMAAITFKSGQRYTPVGIKQILPRATWILNHEGFDQTPGVVFESGNLQVPFLIDADQTEIKHKRTGQLPMRKALPKRRSNGSLLGGVIVAIAIIGLLGGFDE